jgi:UDP-N-acetylglucosamine:LPS N-acetylglucosamine transferase
MEQLVEAFAGFEVSWVTYESKTTSHLCPARFVRHFGDNWLRLFLTLMHATFVAARTLIAFRPRVIVSTGSEIAVPFFYLGRLFGTYTIFVESLTRTTSGSWTGRLVWPFSDRFLVQWPSLLKWYGTDKAQYAGAVL